MNEKEPWAGEGTLGGIHKGRPADPPGGGSEKPDKTGRWGGGRRGGFVILRRPKAKKKFLASLSFLYIQEVGSTY